MNIDNYAICSRTLFYTISFFIKFNNLKKFNSYL